MNDQVVGAIVAESVTVRYGRRVAVDGVTFAVPRGTVYALLGRNGAGKSSLVRCMVGQQQPQQGAIRVFGENAWTQRTSLMERVGIVSEEADAPPEMRVAAVARFCRSLYSRWDQADFDRRLERFDIPPRARYGELSKGQKKEVALALALASAPELLLLDDPTLGLDVVARKALFEEVITELADRGITVVITTHDLAGVESIADRVGILSGGRLMLDEELETLKSRFRRVRFAARPVPLESTNLEARSVRSWGTGTEAVVSNYDELAFERFRDASQIDLAEVVPMSLEEIFIAVAGEQGAAS